MTEWEKARSLSIEELYNFKGQVIPWPPTDDDVLWWAKRIVDLHKYKDHTLNKEHKGFVFTDKFEPNVDGRFGEYAFGIKTGLRPWLIVWPTESWYDYKFSETTVDVKTAVQKSQNVHLLLPIKEIERSEKYNAGKLADIFVLAWLAPNTLSLNKVVFLGWSYRNELLKAPIKNFGYPAHAINHNDLRSMEDLYQKINPPPPPTREPHWVEPKKKGQQILPGFQ